MARVPTIRICPFFRLWRAQWYGKLAAEFIGTFWLVFGGCGSAVLAAAFPEVGIGLLGVVAGVRAHRPDNGLCDRPHLRLPPQSGGHDRPLGRRIDFRPGDVVPYVVAQVVGAIAAASLLLSDRTGGRRVSTSANGLAQNGYGDASPGTIRSCRRF